jgi:hypothetical protein
MNNNKQQTAVEFIEYQVLHKRITDYFLLREMIKQAKEMEKEQIIKAYENMNSMAMYGEQYYNETFNNKP